MTYLQATFLLPLRYHDIVISSYLEKPAILTQDNFFMPVTAFRYEVLTASSNTCVTKVEVKTQQILNAPREKTTEGFFFFFLSFFSWRSPAP